MCPDDKRTLLASPLYADLAPSGRQVQGVDVLPLIGDLNQSKRVNDPEDSSKRWIAIRPEFRVGINYIDAICKIWL